MAEPYYCASEAQRRKCTELANENIVFMIERSTNGNVVVYEAMMTDDGMNLDDANPISVYWQDIDDDYMKKLIAKGQTSFKSGLNMIENKMAYGVSSKKSDTNRYTLTLVALPQKPIELVLVKRNDGKMVPRAIGKIADRSSYVRKIFVEAKSTMLGPKVVQVRVYGIAVDNGEEVTETIIP